MDAQTRQERCEEPLQQGQCRYCTSLPLVHQSIPLELHKVPQRTARQLCCYLMKQNVTMNERYAVQAERHVREAEEHVRC